MTFNKDQYQANITLAQLMFQGGDFIGALGLFREALTIPDLPEDMCVKTSKTVAECGYLLADGGRHSEAVLFLGKVLDKLPGEPKVKQYLSASLCNSAVELMQQEKFDLAVTRLEKAIGYATEINHSQNLANSKKNLAICKFKIGESLKASDPRGAIKALEEANTLLPDQKDILTILSITCNNVAVDIFGQRGADYIELFYAARSYSKKAASASKSVMYVSVENSRSFDIALTEANQKIDTIFGRIVESARVQAKAYIELIVNSQDTSTEIVQFCSTFKILESRKDLMFYAIDKLKTVHQEQGMSTNARDRIEKVLMQLTSVFIMQYPDAAEARIIYEEILPLCCSTGFNKDGLSYVEVAFDGATSTFSVSSLLRDTSAVTAADPTSLAGNLAAGPEEV